MDRFVTCFEVLMDPQICNAGLQEFHEVLHMISA